MTGRRYAGGTARRRLARRLSVAAGSILPGAMFVLLPKCPMCLAVWLSAATGVGISTTGAASVRGMLVVSWMAALALAGVLIVRHRALARKLSRRAGCTCHRENLRTVRHGNRAA
jgi:hypothetical protein